MRSSQATRLKSSHSSSSKSSSGDKARSVLKTSRFNPSSLPRNVFNKVNSLLPAPDKARCLAVSRVWTQILSDKKLRRTLEATLTSQTMGKTGGPVLNFAFRSGCTLTTVDIGFTTSLKSAHLYRCYKLLELSPKSLKRLRFEGQLFNTCGFLGALELVGKCDNVEEFEYLVDEDLHVELEENSDSDYEPDYDNYYQSLVDLSR